MNLVTVQPLTNKDPSGFLALTRKGRGCTRRAKNPDGFFAFTVAAMDAIDNGLASASFHEKTGDRLTSESAGQTVCEVLENLPVGERW